MASPCKRAASAGFLLCLLVSTAQPHSASQLSIHVAPHPDVNCHCWNLISSLKCKAGYRNITVLSHCGNRISPMTMSLGLAPKSEPAPDVSIDEVHGTYISQLNILLKDRPDIKWSLVSKGSSQTRVAYTDTRKDYRITSPQDLVAQSAGLTESQELSICIIENISTEYVEAIGTAWGIDPMFFVAHATNPERDRLWSRKWDSSAPDYTSYEDRNEPDEDSSISAPSILDGISGHLSGVFEYHNVIPNLKSSDFEKLDSSPNFIYRHCFKDEKWPLQSNTRISYCRPNKWMSK